MQLFKFFQPYRKYIKTAKNGGFCEELLSENDSGCFSQFLLLGIYYSGNASEAVQLTKQLISSYTYEKTYLAVYCLLMGDTSQVSVFFLTNKNE